MSSKLAATYLLVYSLFFALASPTSAQLNAPPSVPFSGTVPSAAGTCSIAKSCAEVAPDIIRKALNSNSFQTNLLYLKNLQRQVGSEAMSRAIPWATNAFKLAGVDEVHTEKFTVQGGPEGSGDVEESANVIAEIRGRELPDEFVVLAGHLDSTASSGHDAEVAAMIIDAAHAIHASGSLPRRSIRFILFSGTDQRMAGSRAYVDAHRGEMDRMVATIGVDGGAGNVSGFSLAGRAEILARVRDTLAPVRSLGAVQFTTDARISLDTFDFLLEGVPTLIPNVQALKSTTSHAAFSGVYDQAAIDSLKHQVAIVAVSAYAFADTDKRIGSRQSREQLEQLLGSTGLDNQMKAENLWADWETHKRGRQ